MRVSRAVRRYIGTAVAYGMAYPDFRHGFSRFDGRTSIRQLGHKSESCRLGLSGMPRVGIFKIGPLRAELRVDESDTLFGDFWLPFWSDDLPLKSRNGLRTQKKYILVTLEQPHLLLRSPGGQTVDEVKK